MLAWDNVPNGASISCPTIEKALTSSTITDRVLGRSEQITVPATTVQFFTGNNILPRGDMISRSYTIRLNIDRPDPENREFRHQDPFGWTIKHRAAILRALYTLLIWNLRSRAEERPKTRFKRWWTLCGAPIEAVAGVDFNEILRAHESNDAEVTGMVVLYRGLRKTFRESLFTASEVWQLSQAPGMGEPSDDWPISVMAALEEASGTPFLKASADKDSKTIGRRLQLLSGKPAAVGDEILRLDLVPNAARGNRYRITKIE